MLKKIFMFYRIVYWHFFRWARKYASFTQDFIYLSNIVKIGLVFTEIFKSIVFQTEYRFDCDESDRYICLLLLCCRDRLMMLICCTWWFSRCCWSGCHDWFIQTESPWRNDQQLWPDALSTAEGELTTNFVKCCLHGRLYLLTLLLLNPLLNNSFWKSYVTHRGAVSTRLSCRLAQYTASVQYHIVTVCRIVLPRLNCMWC